ncbi:MAG: alkaline phosphatase, partial [Desulfobacteraceae bacterium]
MLKSARSFLFLSVSILFVLSGCIAPQVKLGYKNEKTDRIYKNVIVMVPDGCSMSIQTFARLFKGSDINLDKLNVGSVRTFAANSIITDSAAAATAFASGHKTTTGFLGVGPQKEGLLPIYQPDSMPYYPLPTILEGAKHNGKSTGLVVTCVIDHATPGGFSAHVPSRIMSDDIIEQIVYQDIDVVLGGGGSNLLPAGAEYKSSGGGIWRGRRKDSENLINILQKRGYSFISSRDELEKLGDEKVWGIFNEGNLVPDIDRDELNPSQPSLAEMTEKAIKVLSKNEKGFFLMVEGSQVDYAGHANDPVFMVTEFLAFDKAVGIAVDYAKKDPDTLVVIFPDHDTGGLSIGN